MTVVHLREVKYWLGQVLLLVQFENFEEATAVHRTGTCGAHGRQREGLALAFYCVVATLSKVVGHARDLGEAPFADRAEGRAESPHLQRRARH